jgi:hypothetical protein
MRYDLNAMKAVPLTANLVERLFRIGHIWTSDRKSMNPWTLQNLVFLRENDTLWNVTTVNEVLHRSNISEMKNRSPVRVRSIHLSLFHTLHLPLSTLSPYQLSLPLPLILPLSPSSSLSLHFPCCMLCCMLTFMISRRIGSSVV